MNHMKPLDLSISLRLILPRNPDNEIDMVRCRSVEISAHGITEKTKACVTGRFLPEKPRTDFTFPQLAVDLKSCNHPSEHFEVHSHIRTPSSSGLATRQSYKFSFGI
ncbi:hypothetical protein AgCh_039749 [Apium graveolens]